MSKRANHQRDRARAHQRQQAVKKGHALLAASRFKKAKDQQMVMRDWGYVPDGKGGWRTVDKRNKPKELP